MLSEEEKELFSLCQSVNRILLEIQDQEVLVHRNFEDIRNKDVYKRQGIPKPEKKLLFMFILF